MEHYKTPLDNCPCTGVNLPKLLQPALLSILAREPTYGYAIMQKLSESGLFNDSMPDSAGVYRFLKHMETDGSLYAFWDTSQCGPAKKCYQITPRGLSCLKLWRETLKQHQDFIAQLLSYMD